MQKTVARNLPRASTVARSFITDGPFAETKECVVANWPASAGRYASVNGLRMYYEVQGTGRPLVMLHGGLGNIENTFNKVLSTFAGTRQVIAIEQQAHGRTDDIDRPLSHEQMADDTAELLRQLDVEQADFLGFSMGGAVALQLAVRHPHVARRLALVAGGFYNTEGYNSQGADLMYSLEPIDDRWPPDMKRGFDRFGRGQQWPAAVNRVKQALGSYRGLRQAHLRSVRAPTLLVAGDEDMLIRLDHTDQLSRLLPSARLEVVRGIGHDPALIGAAGPLLPAFLDDRDA
jgi:pimeloyl-ACP methyl ester carboxylesterase